MKSFREENIKMLAEAITGDEFSEVSSTLTSEKATPDKDLVLFIQRNLPINTKYILELGCGSGTLLDTIPVTHVLDPSSAMIDRLKQLNYSVAIEQGFAEYIPYDMLFQAILFFNGFFQIRSDYEALIEINTHLEMGGRFIFNLRTDDSEDIICGRVLGVKNYVRLVKEFGFDIIEQRENGLICVEKVLEFDLRNLRKLQLVKDIDGKFSMNNYYELRDYMFL